jgi:hypothetical protein
MTPEPNAPGLDELTAARLQRYIASRLPPGNHTINGLDRAAWAIEFFCAELDRVNARLATLEAQEAARKKTGEDGR